MHPNKLKALIVGGSSGLGLEIAKQLSFDYEVVVTGRRDPQVSQIKFHRLDLDSREPLAQNLDRLFQSTGTVDTIVFAAGYVQDGKIDELSEVEITNMNHLGLTVPACLVSRCFKSQDLLPNFVSITSTSSFTPRLREPVYCASKAGLAMLTQCFALDDRIGKILLCAPAGMATPFWKSGSRDTSTYLDPKWVAEQILINLAATKKYRYIHVLRDPARVEVEEER